MRNYGLEEAQAGIKIARRNINNLRYADDTTLMAETGNGQTWGCRNLWMAEPEFSWLCLKNHYLSLVNLCSAREALWNSVAKQMKYLAE